MTGTEEQAAQARDAAAQELYCAELALHDAHQTHVDQWINAANERLHVAVEHYLAAHGEFDNFHNGLAA